MRGRIGDESKLKCENSQKAICNLDFQTGRMTWSLFSPHALMRMMDWGNAGFEAAHRLTGYKRFLLRPWSSESE